MKTIIIIAVLILVAVLAICFLFIFCKAAKQGDKLNYEVYNQPSNKKVFVDKCIVCGKIEWLCNTIYNYWQYGVSYMSMSY